MKRAIIITGLLFLALACGSYYWSTQRGSPTSDNSTTVHPDGESAAQSSIVTKIASEVTAPIEGLRRLNEHRAIHLGEIDVAGAVLDQFDRPLTNILVEFAVDQSTSYSPSNKRGSTTTDHTGAFQIKGFEGAAVAIFPKAEGYILIQTNNRVIYSGFYQDAPLHIRQSGTQRVIRMWKLRGAEPLVQISREIRLPTNGVVVETEISLPLLLESPLKLSFSTVGTFGQKHSEQGTWEWRLKSENCSLMEVNNPIPEYIYQVPEGNYTNDFRFKYEFGTPDYARRVSKFYFLEHRSGKLFGTCSLLIVSDALRDGTIPARIDLLLNPNGSRNIEIHSNNVSQVK